MIARLAETFGTWLALKQMERDLDRSLAVRKRARPARQEAARRGLSTEIKRRAEACRALKQRGAL